MVSIADSHAALVRNTGLQFDLVTGSTPPPEVPHDVWHLSADFGEVNVVWLMAALATIAIVVLAIVYLKDRPAAPVDADPRRPADPSAPIAPAVARAALGDADGFAAEGRYLDAAHALLACGVGVIASRHPNLLDPTSTCRDIARMAVLPAPLRLAFGRIAWMVELGLFGGRRVRESDYAECRRVFLASALAEAA